MPRWAAYPTGFEMPRPAQDPLGILARIPELEGLAERDKGVRRAIERGRAHALYRRLFWLRWLGRAGNDTELVKELLKRRRLFIEPLKGAPIMFTYNGIGTSIYGRDEIDPNDATYAKTLFLVFVFVPIFPFGSYVVRDGESSNSWGFMGRLPLGAATYLWQRAIALGILGGVAWGAFSSMYEARSNTVHVVNGLSTPVKFRVGEEAEVTVAPESVAEIRSAVGEQPVTVVANGHEIETGTLDVRRGYDAVVWNVLGVGIVYRESVQYVAKGAAAPSDSKATPRCGESSIVEDDLDYVLEAAPSEISMPKNSSVVYRSRLGFEKGSPELCLDYLANGTKEQQARALELVSRYAEAMNYDVESTRLGFEIGFKLGSMDAVVKLAERALDAHEDSIEHHRYYQSALEQSGQKERALREYEERYAKKPSPDSAYLLARLKVGSGGRGFIEEQLAKAPQHPYLLRSAAYCARLDGDFARTAELSERLRSVDAAAWKEISNIHVDALAGSGKVQEARDLVGSRLLAPQLETLDRMELIHEGVLLSRFEPVADAEPFVQRIELEDKKLQEVLRIRARLDGMLPVDGSAIAGVEDPDARRALTIVQASPTDPQAALSQLEGATEATLALLPLDVWALLTAEAARNGSTGAVSKLTQRSPVGPRGAEALVEYVRVGSREDDLDGYPMELLAAVHFVRARAEGVAEPDRLALLDRAKREDALHGLVSKAMETWPK